VAWGACCIEAALALTIIVDTIMWWGWPDDARHVITMGLVQLGPDKGR